jgi:hypothetical protein
VNADYPLISNEGGFQLVTHLYQKTANGESGDYVFAHASGNTTAWIGAVQGAADEGSVATGVFDADDTPTAPSVDPVRSGALIIFWAKSSNFLGAVTPPSGSTPTFSERLDSATSILYVATGEMSTADPTGGKSVALTEAPTMAGMIAVEAPDDGGEAIELEGISSGRSSAVAALSVVRAMEARASGRSSTSGAASIIRGLTAMVSGRSSGQGAINAIRALSGTSSGRSSAQTALGAIRELVGRAAGICRIVGALFSPSETADSLIATVSNEAATSVTVSNEPLTIVTASNDVL